MTDRVSTEKKDFVEGWQVKIQIEEHVALKSRRLHRARGTSWLRNQEERGMRVGIRARASYADIIRQESRGLGLGLIGCSHPFDARPDAGISDQLFLRFYRSSPN